MWTTDQSEAMPRVLTMSALKAKINEGSVSNLEDTRKSREPIRIRETTRVERYAWIAYNWASSVVTNVCFDFVFPLFLTYLARENGSSYPQLESSVSNKTLPNFDELNRQYPGWYKSGTCIDENRCVIPWMNTYIDPSSWVLYILGLSVIGNVPLYLSLNSYADHGNGRKWLFLFFAFAGAILLAAAPASTPKTYQFGGLMIYLVQICFGVANVFYNAYLPILASAHPSMLIARANESANPSLGGQENLVKRLDHYTQSLSSYGIAMGFAGAIFTSIIAALMFAYVPSPMSLRGIMYFSALWWMLFTIPALMFLKRRGGEPLPRGTWYMVYSLKAFFKIITAIRKIPLSFLYLFAFFLFSDGFHTLSTNLILMIKSEMRVGDKEISILLVLSPAASLLGTLLMYQIQKRFNISSKAMILNAIFGFLALSVYGVLGLSADLPIMKSYNVVPITSGCTAVMTDIGVYKYEGENCIAVPFEFFAMYLIQAFLVGGLRANARTLFTMMIPPNHESLFFCLFELCGKTSIWLGPLVSSAIKQRTGSLMYSFVYLIIVFALSFPMVFFINFAKGRLEAVNYANSLVFNQTLREDPTPMKQVEKPRESNASQEGSIKDDDDLSVTAD